MLNYKIVYAAIIDSKTGSLEICDKHFSPAHKKSSKIYTYSIVTEKCVMPETRSRDINIADDTTINSNDVNRYQRHANISIFCNEFIRHTSRIFSLPLFVSLILPSNQHFFLLLVPVL